MQNSSVRVSITFMISLFPRAIQMTSRAVLSGFPKQQVVENKCEHTHQNEENACFLKSPEHRYVNEVLDFYSYSMQVPWFGHFCPTGTLFADVLTWVFLIKCRVKIDHSPKWTGVRWYAPCKIHHGDLCTYQQTMLWRRGTKWVPWYDCPLYVFQISNGLWVCFHRYPF